MSVENVARKHLGVLASVGKVGLNITNPNEFELYLCALEVTDEEFNTLQYFVFPVMPSSMDESQTFSSNVKKTLGGVVVINNSTFQPRDITLSGTFGRKFRILLGGDYTNFISSFKTAAGKFAAKSVLGGVASLFDDRIKTGYGCIKILEEIVGSANSVSDFKTKRLILHNPAIGNSYLIKPQSLKLSQSQETNMIWSYSLSLKAIAPLEAVMSSSKLQQQRVRLNVSGFLQKGVNNVVDKITQSIGKL